MRARVKPSLVALGVKKGSRPSLAELVRYLSLLVLLFDFEPCLHIDSYPIGPILVKPMHQLTPQTDKEIKWHVSLRSDKDEKVRIEFRRWPGDLLPRFWSIVPPSEVKAELEKYQLAQQEREDREKEIGRQMYADLPPEILAQLPPEMIPDEFKHRVCR